MTRKMDDWSKVKNDILERLDIISEYKFLGLDVTGTPETSNEWVACRCYGEEDKTPSAAINISHSKDRGRYKNFKNDENLSFFDFVCDKAKNATDFFNALELYAKKTGVSLPKQKHCSQNISVIHCNTALAVTWLKAKPPITKEAFLRNGGQLVKENKKNTIYIGLPIFGTIIDTKVPIGWVIWDRLGKDIIVDKTAVKMKTTAGSTSGLMGLHGLQNIDHAKYVWLTEGPTDMLALDSAIPDEMRKEHVTITHSGGAMENPKDWQLEFFKDKNVIVLSDADDAGIKGAKKWSNAIANVAQTTKIVTLPYEHTKSHGKDVRDYFNEGHQFHELAELAENAELIEHKKELNNNLTKLGEIDTETGKIVLSVNHTTATAHAFVKKYYMHDGFCTLKYQNEIFYSWKNNAYKPIEEGYLKQQILYFLNDAVTQTEIRGKAVSNPFPDKDSNVRSALEAIKQVTFLSKDIPAPHWLGDDACPVDDPKMMIFCKTKNYDIKSKKSFDMSPKWFNYNSLDFDYEYDPTRTLLSDKWNKFLHDLFDDDTESVEALMEFIGLLLTPITKYQKALFIVGPKRSGKGTIAKIIQKLVGQPNCCSPTTMGLADRFGLETLIGKTVSITSDARFSKQTTQTAIERILNVTGEDTISIERKFQKTVTMRLPTRMIFLSNELPYFPDSSNAITSRFIVLKLTKSFFDNPNINLEQELLMELPNIFHLAVFSLELLNERGYFIQPKSAKDDVEIMEDMGSPIGRFVKERCNVSSEQWCTSEDLWKEWKKWCAEEDVFAGNDVWFFRNLKSAFPTINSKRKKNELGIFFKFYEGISINFVPF